MPTNDGGHSVDVHVCSAAEEMDALNSLGPLTRAAIYESPIRWSAATILGQVRSAEAAMRSRFPGLSISFDPCDPRLDRNVAASLSASARAVLEKDCDPRDVELALRPLRPTRERRRMARR